MIFLILFYAIIISYPNFYNLNNIYIRSILGISMLNAYLNYSEYFPYVIILSSLIWIVSNWLSRYHKIKNIIYLSNPYISINKLTFITLPTSGLLLTAQIFYIDKGLDLLSIRRLLSESFGSLYYFIFIASTLSIFLNIEKIFTLKKIDKKFIYSFLLLSINFFALLLSGNRGILLFIIIIIFWNFISRSKRLFTDLKIKKTNLLIALISLSLFILISISILQQTMTRFGQFYFFVEFLTRWDGFSNFISIQNTNCLENLKIDSYSFYSLIPSFIIDLNKNLLNIDLHKCLNIYKFGIDAELFSNYYLVEYHKYSLSSFISLILYSYLLKIVNSRDTSIVFNSMQYTATFFLADLGYIGISSGALQLIIMIYALYLIYCYILKI